MSFTESERSRISAGAKRFYGEARKIEQKGKVPAKDGVTIGEAALGKVAESAFPNALDTLMSIETTPVIQSYLQSAAGRKNIGRFIIEAFQKRICTNEKLSKELQKAIEDARKQGVKITNPTADHLAVGSSTVVVLIVASVFSGPVAVALAPLIGGVALLLIQSGIEGFCNWTKQKESDVREESDVRVPKKKGAS